jgi:hypothetical protein
MSTGSSHSAESDDFKLIHGIGPAIEKRLHAVNIRTYAQLAAQTPDDLVDILQGLAGISRIRIAQQDWMGNARQLAGHPAEKQSISNPDKKNKKMVEVAADEDGASSGEKPDIGFLDSPYQKHYSNFTVELWLDKTNQVHRTRVLHVQDRNETAWPGWDGQKLLGFIMTRIGMPDISASQTRAAISHEPGQIPEIPGKPIPISLPGEISPVTKKLDAFTKSIHLQKVEIMMEDSATPSRILRSGDPLHIRLSLRLPQDLPRFSATQNACVEYSAEVFAECLNTGARSMIGNQQGSLLLSEGAGIDLYGQALSTGAYRLEAIVSLSQITKDRSHPQMAFLDGGVIQVD